MATNTLRWVGNLSGAKEPLIMLGKFAAGASQAIKRGELLELTGNTNTEWVPMDAQFAGAGNVAIANEEIQSGDRAGYYEIIVPRPDDIFEFPIDTANDVTVGTELFWSSSEEVTETGSSSTGIGYAVGQEHYPLKQGHLAVDASGDSGTTIRLTSYVRFTIRSAVSFYTKLVLSTATYGA